MPNYAALDGVVVAADDGHPDMNATIVPGCASVANYAVVDHGAGKVGYYWHMRNGSVAVSPGQAVVAGEQLGLVASSGCSNWPHLHFEVRQSGNVVEPYSGFCDPGASGWLRQDPIQYSLYLDDFGVSHHSPNGTNPPAALPRSGAWPQSNTTVHFWGFWKGLPASSTWQVQFVRPNGAVAIDSGLNAFGNPAYYRWSWWWWGYDIPAMQSTAGTWTIQMWFNGALQIAAPVTVVPALIPGFNRAPEPITASLSPTNPSPSGVATCEVDADRALDDLDWDTLRFRYVWEANGSSCATS